MEPTTFQETRSLTGGWVTDYNERRPHSSLDYLIPRGFYDATMKETKG